MADWSGFRIDSKEPIEGGEEIIAWWEKMGQDPRGKLIVFSDGMDIDTIEETYHHFHGRVRTSFGWGTNLTNDFRECAPYPNASLRAFSLVCKVTGADGKPTVKLSDNRMKATGPQTEIERYLKVFGNEQLSSTEVDV